MCLLPVRAKLEVPVPVEPQTQHRLGQTLQYHLQGEGSCGNILEISFIFHIEKKGKKVPGCSWPNQHLTGDVGRHGQSNQRSSSLLHLPRKNLLQAKLILGTSCQSSTRVPGGGQKLQETGLLSNGGQGHGNVADEGT